MARFKVFFCIARKDIITLIITLYNRGGQKSISACTKYQTWRWMSCNSKKTHMRFLSCQPRTRIWGDHEHRLTQTEHLKIRKICLSSGLFPVFVVQFRWVCVHDSLRVLYCLSSQACGVPRSFGEMDLKSFLPPKVRHIPDIQFIPEFIIQDLKFSKCFCIFFMFVLLTSLVPPSRSRLMLLNN